MLYLSASSTNLPPPYLGNARRGPSPNRWPARTTLPTLAKSQLLDVFLFKYLLSFWIHFELTPFYLICCIFLHCLQIYHLLTWGTHEWAHRLIDGQLAPPCPPSPRVSFFGTTFVMLACFPPALPSTPLRPSVYFFLNETLLSNLVKVSQDVYSRRFNATVWNSSDLFYHWWMLKVKFHPLTLVPMLCLIYITFSIIKVSIEIHPPLQMFHSHLPWHPLAHELWQLKPNSLVYGRCLISIFCFYLRLHLRTWSYSLLDHSSTNFAVHMECRIFFVSYSKLYCEITTITYWWRGPNIDGKAEQRLQLEVLILYEDHPVSLQLTS